MTALLRGTGHVRDTAPHPAAKPIERLVGDASTSTTTSTLISLLSYASAVYNQGPTETCVAFTFRRLMQIRAAIQGLSLEASALAMFVMAQGPRAVLANAGIQPAALIEAVLTHGVTTEARWPFDPSKIVTGLPPDVLRAADQSVVSGIAAIPDTGAARLQKIRTALAADFPVGFAMPIDAAYQNWTGTAVYAGPTGPIVGNHMQPILLSDTGKLGVLGSWGPDFGDGGVAWLDENFVASDSCFDFYSLDVAPQGVS